MLDDGRAFETVVCSLKTSLDPRVLDHLAHYYVKKDSGSVTNDEIKKLIETKLGRVVNDHVPDIVPLFAERLRMDLRQEDIEARVARYFMNFERIVEEHGLTSMAGRASTATEAGRQRMKLRCKLLMQNIQPEVLRVEVLRLAELTHRHVRTDDVALHELLAERVTQQQQAHLMSGEIRGGGAPA